MDGYEVLYKNVSQGKCKGVEETPNKPQISIDLNDDPAIPLFQKHVTTSVDIKAKEAILVTLALLLLTFSLVQFYKKWVKHYRDINQGSFNSYYYTVNNQNSIPTLSSPGGLQSQERDGKKNWNKLGAAITVNARVKALSARQKLEEAKTRDPLIKDSLLTCTLASSRKSSIRPPSATPTKWNLVKTLVQVDNVGKDPAKHRDRELNASTKLPTVTVLIDGIESERGKSPGKRYVGNLTGPDMNTGYSGRLLIPPNLEQIPRRKRIKSRSLDNTADTYHINRSYNSDVFNDFISNQMSGIKHTNISKGPLSIHNEIMMTNTITNQQDVENDLVNDKSGKSLEQKTSRCEKLERVILEEQGTDENMTHYKKTPNTIFKAEEGYVYSNSDAEIPQKKIKQQIKLPTSESWINVTYTEGGASNMV